MDLAVWCTHKFVAKHTGEAQRRKVEGEGGEVRRGRVSEESMKARGSENKNEWEDGWQHWLTPLLEILIGLFVLYIFIMSSACKQSFKIILSLRVLKSNFGSLRHSKIPSIFHDELDSRPIRTQMSRVVNILIDPNLNRPTAILVITSSLLRCLFPCVLVCTFILWPIFIVGGRLYDWYDSFDVVNFITNT